MANVDQRGFSNQVSTYVSAREASSMLGIKLETLYAYASRGLVASVPGMRGRPRRYLVSDLDRLRARHDSRAGHAAVAAAALRWGDPVLESALTAIDARGPRYRGHLAVALAERDAPFESVAELLWSGRDPSTDPAWPAVALGVGAARLAALLGPDSPVIAGIALLLPALAARDPHAQNREPSAVMNRARALVPRMAGALALAVDPHLVEPALAGGRVADIVAAALGAGRSREARRAINRTLILCADHELNVSAFAARVAASADSDLYACVTAALATLSGPRHGGVCDRVEAWVTEAALVRDPAVAVRARLRRGEEIPGHGHPLYPQGDPRALPLLELAHALAPRNPRVRTVLALARAVQNEGHGPPTVDFGLVALASALRLRAGAAIALFAIGRSAGWVAHVIEQYGADFLLRPRARYIGP